MKYLKKYEKFKNEEILTEEDYDLIEKELIDKFKENNINMDVNSLNLELKNLKINPKSSYIGPIIKKIYQQKYSDLKYHPDIRYSGVKFFNYKYKDILDKYKMDQKIEFDSNKNRNKNNNIFLPFEGDMVKVPNSIGHNYIPFKILPLDDLQTKYSNHKRLKVFANKGLKCVNCDRIGKYLIAAKDRSGSIHIDLYTKDFELMTVDHIKPKWIGGTYDIENLDPMCRFCNTEKGGDYCEILSIN